MLNSLPVGDIRFLSDEEVASFKLADISTDINADQGFILTVDLFYPPGM